MIYDFKESKLANIFRTETQQQLRNFLNPSGIVSLIGMPGVGISFFLRFMATRPDAHYVYLDVATLPQYDNMTFFRALKTALTGTSQKNTRADVEAIKEVLQEQIEKTGHVILLINRFDLLGTTIDAALLNILRTLRHNFADKLSLVLAMHTPLTRLAPQALEGPNLDMYSNVIYFKPYSDKDMHHLNELHTQQMANKKVLDLAKGHYQLMRMIQNAHPANPVNDPAVILVLKQIYENLNVFQRKQVQTIAFGKTIQDIDKELVETGLVVPREDRITFFSPLFGIYVLNRTTLKLTAKEAKLFRLLKRKLGRIVSKDEIFDDLWTTTEDGYGSDWALNALIYRLRKNQAFTKVGYIIENHKKLGYALLKV